MPNDFQVNFLNGLEMARSTQGAKLDAMQQAASMQYQISAKQMDFQMGLLKLRESQAAQAVEMRMAQDEHELEMKKNALMVEKFEMEKQVVSAKMEDDKLASAAGAALQMWQVGLRDEGIVPGSVNEFRATDTWLNQGVKLSKDERVHTRAVAEYNARKTQMQETFFTNGLTYLNKINASRTESRVDPETGETASDKMYGVGNEGELEVVLEQFKRGAELGHEPSQRMYARVQGLLEGVTAPAPGVKDAANAGGSLLSEYGATKPMGRGFTGGDTDAQVDEAVSALSRSEAEKYTDTARTKLETAYQGYLQTGDSRSAKIVASRLAKLDLLQQAVNAPGERVDQTGFAPGAGAYSMSGPRRTSSTTYTPTKMDLWNLSQMTDPEAMVGEIDAILQRRQTNVLY